MTITPEQIAEWRRLAEAATEGPWITKQTVIHGRAYGGLWIEGIDKEDGGELLLQISGSGGARSYTTRVVDTQQHDANDANAAFIAAARTGWSETINALEAAYDEIERLKSAMNMAAAAQPALLAEVERLQAECEWRDIATAPRDGTPIIVVGGTVAWLHDGWFSHIAQRHLQWEPKVWRPLTSPHTQEPK